ncbi:MAG: site-specific integrase, partial [Desulfobacterales bacterium]|nr:site-specific integrase [Desulfobacterales bacterium]
MKQSNLIKMAKEFERSLKVLNRSKRTIREIMRKLNTFLDYLQSLGIKHIDGITKDIVREYQIEIYQTINTKGWPNSAAYQNSMMCAVKQFLKYLSESGYMVS